MLLWCFNKSHDKRRRYSINFLFTEVLISLFIFCYLKVNRRSPQFPPSHTVPEYLLGTRCDPSVDWYGNVYLSRTTLSSLSQETFLSSVMVTIFPSTVIDVGSPLYLSWILSEDWVVRYNSLMKSKENKKSRRTCFYINRFCSSISFVLIG